MGKLRLSRIDLRQFPTIDELLFRNGGKDRENWGMCQNADGKISFREPSSEWQLVFSLKLIIDESIASCGKEAKAKDIVLFYGVESLRDVDGYNVEFEFIDLSWYDEVLQSPPFFEHLYRQQRNQKRN